LIDQVAEAIGERRAAVTVLHVDNHDAADALGAALTDRLPHLEALTVADMGPVLSVHLGAGAVGVCLTLLDD
jgi:fatty acid-binding protein DegV